MGLAAWPTTRRVTHPPLFNNGANQCGDFYDLQHCRRGRGEEELRSRDSEIDSFLVKYQMENTKSKEAAGRSRVSWRPYPNFISKMRHRCVQLDKEVEPLICCAHTRHFLDLSQLTLLGLNSSALIAEVELSHILGISMKQPTLIIL